MPKNTSKLPVAAHKLPAAARHEIAEQVRALKAVSQERKWNTEAYNKQREPSDPRHPLPDPVTGISCGCQGGNYRTWLLMTGRGYGKTRTGSNWVLNKGLQEKVWIAVCAPAFDGVQKVCFEGKTGILAQALPGEVIDYNRNQLEITLRNGTKINGFSAMKPDSIRGRNIAYCWFDELGVIQYDEFYYEGLLPAMRGATNSQMIVTTTPRPDSLIIRDLIKNSEEFPDRVHYTRASSSENWHDPSIAEMIKEMETRLHHNKKLLQLELEGMLVEDVDGAFFTFADFDKNRVLPDDAPQMRRVVVGVDPASSASRDADEHGISVCGEGEDGHLYTLEDCSMRGSVEKILRRAIAAYHRWDAELMVVENQVAGDWFRHALYQEDPYVNYRPIHAMKSKRIRAFRLTPLAKDGKIHMICRDVHDFEILERQLISMTDTDDRERKHDDRADAWVYAMLELAGDRLFDWKEVYGFVPCRRCGFSVNEVVDKNCKKCGADVTKTEKETSKVSHEALRWSKAYYNTCSAGHEFPMRMKECPKCKGSPSSYMAAVAAITGGGGWLPYNGRNPLDRRKP